MKKWLRNTQTSDTQYAKDYGRITGRRLQTIRKHFFMHNPLCVSCKAKGVITQATELDHITPLFKGGTNDIDNLQGLCADCHKDKTRIDMGWKHEVGLDGWPV